MKENKKWILIIICSLCVISASSQAPFSRGINLTGWFQVSSPGQIQFTRFTKQPSADRAYWYSIVRQYLEENNIPWTIWDYKGGFGLFNKGSNELFEHDLNVPLLQSLNFNIPPQTPFSIQPDTAGFIIYTDYIGQKIYDASYSSGTIDFYSHDLPNNDNYCLYWNGFNQYNAIGFDFNPDRDLTRLVSQGYAIDFMVRGLKIRTLENETQGPGNQSLTWDGCSDNGVPVQRGIYICMLKSPGYFISGKIIKY